MTLKFWGVRGSYPVPGPHVVRYGGNTSCVSVHLDGVTLVLDAGTGIIALGEALAQESSEILLLLSHVHWDHIQGLPFFTPLYDRNRAITLLPYEREGSRWSPGVLMDGLHFPIVMDSLPSRWRSPTGDALQPLRARGLAASRIPANHPGGAYGYRVEHAGYVVVYLPDNELYPPGEPKTSFAALAAFCHGADVLVHDAQYLERELPEKRGRGHSSVFEAAALALTAGVKHLVLFHHDPARRDAELDEIQEEARAWLRDRGSGVACTAAFEGMVLRP